MPVAACLKASEDGLEAYAKGEELDAEIVLASRADLAALGLVEWLESEVEEENWNARWEADYPEVRVGNCGAGARTVSP